jgi:aminoglycoside phosphotransferase
MTPSPKPVAYASSAVCEGSEARSCLTATLTDLGFKGVRLLSNPTSGRDDGVTPTRTPVVICEDTRGDRVCVKFYEDSDTGRDRLRSHAKCLSSLQGAIPAPEVIAIEEDGARLGLPALITTCIGDPLDHAIADVTGSLRIRLTEDIAECVATLRRLNTADLGLRQVSAEELGESVTQMFRTDAEEYLAGTACCDEVTARLVRQGAEMLATHSFGPQRLCLAHRDLTGPNIMVRNQSFSGLVDWDHASIDPPARDVGSCIAGLLVTLPIPEAERVEIAGHFLQHWQQVTDGGDETRNTALLFALDALLDWLLGRKNAPRGELVWATSLVLGALRDPQQTWR